MCKQKAFLNYRYFADYAIIVLKALINLDERISQCEEVLDFFSVEEEDINPNSDNE